MATSIIGDKAIFAIEYQQIAENRGYFRIWLSGHPVGSMQDEVHLNLIKNWKVIQPLSEDHWLVKLFLTQDVKAFKEDFDSDFFANGSDGMKVFQSNFEDFGIRIFELHGQVCFFALLCDAPYASYSEEYTSQHVFATLPKTKWDQVIDEFALSIRQYSH